MIEMIRLAALLPEQTDEQMEKIFKELREKAKKMMEDQECDLLSNYIEEPLDKDDADLP